MSNKILVVSPHPDDETLGCGGTIFKHKSEKNKLYWIIMTKMSEYNYSSKSINNRNIEIKKVANKYKFEKVYNLDYKASELENYKKNDIIDNLKKIIINIKPSILYLPFPNDAHSDHRITYESFIPFSKSFRYNFIKKIRIYETLSETEQVFFQNISFKPNLFIDIQKYIKNKITVMNIYKSEIKKHPFPRSAESIKALAKLRGIQSNLNYAEAFMSIKEVL